MHSGQNTRCCRKRDYLRLNVRVQKSLIIDFDFEAAQKSALEDWKIDFERQRQDRELQSPVREEEEEEEEAEGEGEGGAEGSLNYERLCEFFFDLCVSWCQYLDIETFLFFLHAIFLNVRAESDGQMTRGESLASSTFKHLDGTEVMPLSFFNLLLSARNRCAERHEAEHFERYYQWARYNMHRTHEVASNVQAMLRELFASEEESRRVDELFPDFETQVNQSFIESHIDKIDRNLDHLSKNTTFFMSTFYQQNLRIQDRSKKEGGGGGESSIAILGKQALSAGVERSAVTATLEPRSIPLAGLTREDKERIIEQRVIDAAPPYLEQGRLEEIRETSFLIMNEKRLPLFGRAITLFQREQRSTIGGAPSSMQVLQPQQQRDHVIPRQQTTASSPIKSPKEAIDSTKRITDFDTDHHLEKRQQAARRKASAGQLLGAAAGEQVTVMTPDEQHKLKGSSSDHSPNKRGLKRVVSPLSKTDNSVGGVSSSMLDVPSQPLKQIVVVESKKATAAAADKRPAPPSHPAQKAEKRQQQQQAKRAGHTEINITVPETKLPSREREREREGEGQQGAQKLANYNKPIVSGLSLASSAEENQQRYVSSGLLLQPGSEGAGLGLGAGAGPPPNATGSQFGGELAISPNLISESTLRTIYDKYLERSPPSERVLKAKPPLSMESLRVALRAEGKLGGGGGTSSDHFNGEKLAEILKEEGLLLEYPERPKSFFAKPLLPQLKSKESSSGDKILATGAVTGSTQFQFLKGLTRKEVTEEGEGE